MKTFRLGTDRLTVDWVRHICARACSVDFDAETHDARLLRSRAVIEDAVRHGRAVYGVTTGFGAACENAVDPKYAQDLARNLPRYHGIGVGEPLADEDVRGILVARAASLVRGMSGVRPLVVHQLVNLLRADVLPIIPSRGSVGASGDLTPLSYVAACLEGDRRARLHGETLPTAEALRRVGLMPLTLGPKESLAIMNGTSMMAAMTARSCARARRIGDLACVATALASHAMDCQPAHFDARIFAAKPHPGTVEAARRIRASLGVADRPHLEDKRIQDRYSIRCAPHVVGVLLDTLAFCVDLVEIELDGVSDNPIIDPDTGDCMHGGNFYGGHVAFAADALKQTLASVAELLERQIVLLNGAATNGGLPANLVVRSGADRASHHGFKALEITASALVAEALKTAAPASVFSRSTEGHNQDKVSMGSIAALELDRVVWLSEAVLCLHVLASVQAAELRGGRPPDALGQVIGVVRGLVEPLDADRPLDADFSALMANLDALSDAALRSAP